MKEVTVGSNEAGQRLDKFLKKYLKEAGSGFLYKMLRKKNITLNGAKADGSEKLASGGQGLFFPFRGDTGKIPRPGAGYRFRELGESEGE